MTNKLALAVAILLGFLSVMGIRSYVEDLEKKVQISGDMTTFIVFASDFDEGHILTQDDIEEKDFQTVAITEALRGTHITKTELPGYLNRRLRNRVQAGQLVVQDYFDVGGGPTVSITKNLEPQYRLVTIPVDAITSVNFLIRPGDFVDVVSTMPLQDRGGQAEVGMTFTALQDVPVVATGIQTNRAAGVGQTYGTITVRVTVKDANALIYMLHNRVPYQLVLRPPGTPKASSSNPTLDDHLTADPQRDLRR